MLLAGWLSHRAYWLAGFPIDCKPLRFLCCIDLPQLGIYYALILCAGFVAAYTTQTGVVAHAVVGRPRRSRLTGRPYVDCRGSSAQRRRQRFVLKTHVFLVNESKRHRGWLLKQKLVGGRCWCSYVAVPAYGVASATGLPARVAHHRPSPLKAITTACAINVCSVG